MSWKLELVEVGPTSGSRRLEVGWLGEIHAPASVDDIGLNHAMAHQLLADLQRAVVELQEARLREYVDGQSAYLVDHAQRQRAGKPVGTSISEGLATALVNRRMNKLQQMRWSAAGAHAVVTMRLNAMNAATRRGVVATAATA